jgi:transcriptional regulator with XRE-family HTH domain
MLRMPAGQKQSSPEKRAFARVLSQVRQERHLTQEALAFESGYHPKYISLLERGKYSPSLTTILELAEVLQLSAAELVARVERLLPRSRKRRRETHALR